MDFSAASSLLRITYLQVLEPVTVITTFVGQGNFGTLRDISVFALLGIKSCKVCRLIEMLLWVRAIVVRVARKGVEIAI